MSNGEIDGLYIREADKPPRRSSGFNSRPSKRPRLEDISAPPLSAATAPTVPTADVFNMHGSLHESAVEPNAMSGTVVHPLDPMVEAMASGNLDTVKHLHVTGLGAWSDTAGAAAAAAGHIDCITYAREHGCQLGRLTVNAAIKHGQVETLHYLRSHNAIFDAEEMEYAVECNCLDSVQFLYSVDAPWGDAHRIAARKGYFDVFKFLMDNGSTIKRTKSIVSALQSCDTSCISYLCSTFKRKLVGIDPMPLVESGSWVGLKYLLETAKRKFSIEVCIELLRHRQFHLLALATGAERDISEEAEKCLALNDEAAERLFVQSLSPLKTNAYFTPTGKPSKAKSDSPESIVTAAWSNNVAEMARLRTEGVKWHIDTCTAAAKGGCLKALKYAHENGCPWRSAACEAAVELNRLEVLRYLLDNGCPKGSNLLKIAVDQAHKETTTLLMQRGCKFDLKQCIEFAQRGQYGRLKHMTDNGYVLSTEVCVHAALNGRVGCLELAHAHGAKIDQKVVLGAVQQGQLPCLIYALDNGGIMTKTLPAEAIKYRHMDVLKYLHENNCPMDKKTLAVVHALNQPAVPINNPTPASVEPVEYVVDLT